MASIENPDESISRSLRPSGNHRSQNNTTREPIGDDQDVTVRPSEGKVFDKIHGNVTPFALGDREGFQKAVLAVSPDLIGTALVAIGAEAAVVVGNAWPVELAAQYPISTLASWMAG